MAKSREIIQLHLGQAGIQIASCCWELYCLEHGILTDGTIYDPEYGPCSDHNFNSFFSVSSSGRAIPRVLLLDLEPSVIDEIRCSCYRQLFPPSSMISGKEDAANNFGMGKFGVGNEMIGVVMEKIDSLVEQCDSLQGFMLFRALGGGTGSGFGTLLLESLMEEYSRVTKVDFNVFPSPRISPIIVEPYNAVLGTHMGMDLSGCCILLDNEALYETLDKRLGVPSPRYLNLNRVIAQVVSCITSSLRFSGAINVDLAEFQTNLVPFPRIHYPLVSYAPLSPRGDGGSEVFSTAQITNQVFGPTNHLVKCDPTRGRYMSCCLLYRGDVCSNDIYRSINEMKQKRCDDFFVNWSPTGFKIGINYQPPICVPGGDLAHSNKALCMLSNSTAIRVAWNRISRKSEVMLKKKAFLHHYSAEGIEEGDFREALENLKTLVSDYHEVESDTPPSSGKKKKTSSSTSKVKVTKNDACPSKSPSPGPSGNSTKKKKRMGCF